MKFFVYCDGKILGDGDNIVPAEVLAKTMAVKMSPKMVSIRDDGQKPGDPARRTYKVENGVMKWSALSDSKIDVGETAI